MAERQLECKHCGYAWQYRGSAPYYTSCPRCHANVRTTPRNP